MLSEKERAHLPEVWQVLKEEKRPIVLYGMGDGAEKILNVFAQYGIEASAMFASDGFARGNLFHGFRVGTLQDVLDEWGQDIVIVLCFASQRPEVMAQIQTLAQRFTVYAPDVPVIGEGLFTKVFWQAHAEKIETVRTLLADETSKEVFDHILRYKITGNIEELQDCETPKEEVFTTLLPVRQDEDFVDLGAYTGDTIRELLHYTGGCYHSITAFEPDAKNRKKLAVYLQMLAQPLVQVVEAGAWSQDTYLPFAGKAGRNSSIGAQGKTIAVRSVDSVLGGRRCTFLKLDVEGAEKEALLGAKQTIQTFQPKLNVALYHRNADLFELPLLIHAMCPQYRLYLRHHPYIPAWDTNLYAIAD